MTLFQFHIKSALRNFDDKIYNFSNFLSSTANYLTVTVQDGLLLYIMKFEKKIYYIK